MAWTSFMLYMASIPSYGGDEEDNKPKIETVDVSTLF
jgi:hypothetical protein